MKTRKHLAVDHETYELVVINCVNEFLNYNPEFKGMKITHNHIIRRIAEHYIESKGI